HSWVLASTLCFKNHGPIMDHEFVPTATCYAFGSHPRRVFSITYLLTGFFHCGGTMRFPILRATLVTLGRANTFGAHSGKALADRGKILVRLRSMRIARLRRLQ